MLPQISVSWAMGAFFVCPEFRLGEALASRTLLRRYVTKPKETVTQHLEILLSSYEILLIDFY